VCFEKNSFKNTFLFYVFFSYFRDQLKKQLIYKK
jgi:hypothetical protein